jgi:hypothetical protein
MHRLRGKLTYSNVISTLCLVLLLGGGTAYAASELERESVGTKQLAKEAVTPSKLSKGAKKALTGAKGATGAVGPQGIPGVKGETGKQGEPGKNLTTQTPLPSGQSETGVFSASGNGNGTYIVGMANFVQPLSAALGEEHVIFEGPHQTSTECPAEGQAKAGYLCVYSDVEENVSHNSVADPILALDGASKYGAEIFYNVEGSTAAYAYGSWTVTAP